MKYLALFVLLFFASVSQVLASIDFTIAEPVIVDNLVTVNASVSGTTSNYYLQGTLRSIGSSKYFGETVSATGSWINYISSPEKEFITSNFFLTSVQNASWSGTLKMRYFADDDNYTGPGPYELKFRRFTGSSGSAAGESNTLTINLAATIPSPSPSPSPSPTMAPTPSPSLHIESPQATREMPPDAQESGRPTLRPSPSLYSIETAPIGTVAGEATNIDLSGFGASPSPTLQPDSAATKPSLNQSRIKTVLLIGTGLLLLSIAGFFLRRRIMRQ